MSLPWFCSDLHLGNEKMAKVRRGFASAEDHDLTLIENINSKVKKADKLFVLGDLADYREGLQRFRLVNCNNIEFLFGNHDKFSLREYKSLGLKIHGFRKYHKFWLSHCPIHPYEFRSCVGNLHGHIHITGAEPYITDDRYFCVNPEFHNMMPVCYTEIQNKFGIKN